MEPETSDLLEAKPVELMDSDEKTEASHDKYHFTAAVATTQQQEPSALET